MAKTNGARFLLLPAVLSIDAPECRAVYTNADFVTTNRLRKLGAEALARSHTDARNALKRRFQPSGK